jgi:hypothetical protein
VRVGKTRSGRETVIAMEVTKESGGVTRLPQVERDFTVIVRPSLTWTPVGLDRPHEWHLDHVLGDEPDLQFVAADHVAHDQVVRPIVAAFGRTPRHRARFLQYDLVRVQQARDLHRHLLSTLGRTRNQRRLGDVVSHGHADATRQLDALGDLVDEVVLLAVVFVEQQVQLIEGWPRDLPVVFLVQIAQGHGIRQELVESFNALLAGALRQRNRKLHEMAERVNLVRVLRCDGLGLVENVLRVDQFLATRLLLEFVTEPLTRGCRNLCGARSRCHPHGDRTHELNRPGLVGG